MIGNQGMIAQAGLRNVALMAVLLMLTACGSDAALQQAGRDPSPGQLAATAALEQVGVPYRFGGNSPRGFDCSGLVHYAYLRAGVSVPRTTTQLWTAAEPVARDELRAGDLLFFRIDGKMSHVGLYLGERRFVHAPQSGRTVSVASLETPFYRQALIRAGRVY
jgi:cell wall-associated NlpC family hydrolase